mgnify:CR=1 FL=1
MNTKTIFITFLLILPHVKAQSKDLIVSIGSYAPFHIAEYDYIDVPENEAKGIFIDVIKQFAKQHPEYSLHFRAYPVLRSIRMTGTGETIDIAVESPLFVKEGTLNHYDFSEAVVRTKDVVITNSKSQLTYKSPKDLYNKTIAVIKGYKYGEFDTLEKAGKIRYQALETHQRALRFLQRGSADAYLGNIHVTPYYIKKNGMNRSEFIFSKKAMLEFDLAFLVKKDLNVLSKLDEFIRKIKKNGALNKIITKYIE